MERKSFLKNFALAALAGPMIWDGCKKDSIKDNTTGTSTSDTSTNGNNCIVSPTETEGPYPYPAGEKNNPLDRSDVTGGQTGVPLTINFLVVNVGDNCNVVNNARIDIWHCNRQGYYSGYVNQPGLLGTKSYVGETWLRGYQATDSNGLAKFLTVYPGWYSGRATHIHMEVYVNGVLKKTTQLTFSETISDTVHKSDLYSAHGVNPTRNASDSVFGDSKTDLANETMSLTGSVAEGYSGTFTIGISV